MIDEKLLSDLALLEAINRLNTEFKDTPLSKGQIYKLYQSCNPDDYRDIVGYALVEELP